MRTYFKIIIVCILLVAFICTGCFRPSKPGPPYKTFTLTRGIAHFSFEYSTYYNIYDVGGWDKDSSGVGLRSPNINDFQLSVMIWPISKEFPDARTLMNTRIRNAITGPLVWENELRLPDESEITIDGVLAYQITYNEMVPGFNIKGLEKKFDRVYHEVIFDYNDMIWDIRMISDSSKDDINNAEFDHILKTFKFLP